MHLDEMLFTELLVLSKNGKKRSQKGETAHFSGNCSSVIKKKNLLLEALGGLLNHLFIILLKIQAVTLHFNEAPFIRIKLYKICSLYLTY